MTKNYGWASKRSSKAKKMHDKTISEAKSVLVVEIQDHINKKCYVENAILKRFLWSSGENCRSFVRSECLAIHLCFIVHKNIYFSNIYKILKIQLSKKKLDF